MAHGESEQAMTCQPATKKNKEKGDCDKTLCLPCEMMCMVVGMLTVWCMSKCCMVCKRWNTVTKGVVDDCCEAYEHVPALRQDERRAELLLFLRARDEHKHAARRLGAGKSNCMVVDAGDRVFFWGINRVCERTCCTRVPTKVGGLSKVTELAIRGAHGVAATRDGTAMFWDMDQMQYPPWPVDGFPRAVQVAIGGGGHCLVRTARGTLYEWSYLDVYAPRLFQTDMRVCNIACGDGHCMLLDENKRPFAWGDNLCGQLGNGEQGTARSQPTPMVLERGILVVQIEAASDHSMLLTDDGVLYACGADNGGNMGLGVDLLYEPNHPSAEHPKLVMQNGCVCTPTVVQVPTEGGVIKFTTSDTHTLAVKKDGKLFGCGSNGHGELGLPATCTARVSMTLLERFGDTELKAVVDVQAGCGHTMVWTSDGQIRTCGLAGRKQLKLRFGDRTHTPTA